MTSSVRRPRPSSRPRSSSALAAARNARGNCACTTRSGFHSLKRAPTAMRPTNSRRSRHAAQYMPRAENGVDERCATPGITRT